MVTWAGWIITLCGCGHTVGALVQVVPRYSDAWLGGALWQEQNRDLLAMTDTTAGFWFTVYSFGIPLILLGLLVVWAGRRGLTPPAAVAWALATWTLVGEVASGPSPLMLLVFAAGMLVVASRRAATDSRTDLRQASGRGSAPPSRAARSSTPRPAP